MDNFRPVADAILDRVITCNPRVPGVVAMATDKHGNFYEGAAGERVMGGDDMTTDSVFGIFSTTKAITGMAVLQAVEEGKLDLDAPAKNYAHVDVAHGRFRLRFFQRDLQSSGSGTWAAQPNHRLEGLDYDPAAV